MGNAVYHSYLSNKFWVILFFGDWGRDKKDKLCHLSQIKLNANYDALDLKLNTIYLSITLWCFNFDGNGMVNVKVSNKNVNKCCKVETNDTDRIRWYWLINTGEVSV